LQEAKKKVVVARGQKEGAAVEGAREAKNKVVVARQAKNDVLP